MHSFSWQERILEKFRPVQKLNSRNCYQIHDHPKSPATERVGAFPASPHPCDIASNANDIHPVTRLPCPSAFSRGYPSLHTRRYSPQGG